jgi:hypothetical protein
MQITKNGMVMDWPPDKLDTSPLDTDFNSFRELWEDLRKFAKEHPDHKIIWADDPGFHHTPQRIPRIGVSAFLTNSEDEQAKEWTIPVSNMKTDEFPDVLRRAFQTARGRNNLIDSLRITSDNSE